MQRPSATANKSSTSWMTLFPDELINVQEKGTIAKGFLHTLFFDKVESTFFLVIEWVQSLCEIQLFLTLYGVSVVICDTLCDSLQG